MAMIGNPRGTWLCPFFQFLDYAVDNAFILYKHNCTYYKQTPIKLLDFRLRLVHLLLRQSRCRKRLASRDYSMEEDPKGSCCLVRSIDVDLKRGRCCQCVLKNRNPVRFTSFACSFCSARLLALTNFTSFELLMLFFCYSLKIIDHFFIS